VAAALSASPIDAMLKSILLDITLFEAYTTLAPQNIPDIRVKRSDMARADLKAWANGNTYCPLPLLTDGKVGRGRIAYGEVNTTAKPSGTSFNF
jgi:hypothetical protein